MAMMALSPWAQADRVRIGRLRLRGGTASGSPRLRLAAMLDRAELRPSGVPPSAVLIVRHMADPLPWRLDPQHLGNPVDAAWERAARDRIQGYYRAAGRPRLGAVADDAEAVLFADEAELLACLARDAVSGKLRERWWWRSLLARLSGSSTPATILAQRAAALPGALALLAQENRAADIVRALTAEEALQVLSAVATAYEARDLVACLRSSAGATRSMPAPPGDHAERASDSDLGRRQEPSMLTLSLPAPPWTQWLPRGAVAADLERAQACLLGVALVFHRRPDAPRGADFAVSLSRWWGAMRPSLPQDLPASAHQRRAAPPGCSAAPPERGWQQARSPSSRSLRAPIGAPSPRAQVPVLQPPEASVEDRHALAASSPDMPPAETARAQAPILAAHHHAPEHQSVSAEPAVTSLGTSPSSISAATAAPSPPASTELPPVVPILEAPPPATAWVAPPAGEGPKEQEPGLALEGGVETGLGGVLFLINLMCALSLPEVFEADWHLASGLGAWGVLDALARSLLAPSADVVTDPIWSALALLSGDRDAAKLASAATYRLPETWLAQLPVAGRAPAAWAARRGRLRHWSQAGYMLCETRLDRAAAPAEAGREARRWGGVRTPPRAAFAAAPLVPLAGPLIGGLDRKLKHWLALALPFLRRRLEGALGLARDDHRLADALLARPGRLFVTRTHVDLAMGLNGVTLPVRLAGLDRSPGWLAEFGRVILFHFE